MKYAEFTEKIIKAAYRVHNVLGFGFLEKVYQNALMIEIRNMGFNALSEEPITVYYEDEIVGQYVADMLVNQFRSFRSSEEKSFQPVRLAISG